MLLDKMIISLLTETIAFSYRYNKIEIKYRYYRYLGGKLVRIKTGNKYGPFAKYFIFVDSKRVIKTFEK